MKLNIGILLTLAALIFSCNTRPTSNPSVNGIWECLGSGIFLEIKDSASYSFYDVTSISCLPGRSSHFGELEILELKNDSLSLQEGVLRYTFIRAKQMPALCNAKLEEEKAKDPLYNFDVFSETVKEHYAFLELNKINWDALYDEQRGKLNKESADAELFLLIEETLEKLNDNHAFLEATDEVEAAIDELLSEEEEESNVTETLPLPEYGDFPVAKMVADHHLQEEMTEDSWLIQWGKLNDDIGYVQIKTMWLYADIVLPESLIEKVGFVDAYIETRHKLYEGEYIEKEIQGVRRTMDKVMADLTHMKSMIIDVRFNGGGQDAVSFEILRRFSPTKIQAAKQKFRYRDKFTAEVPIYIHGAKDAFTKPVYILTSPQTGSAAEAFSVGSMSLPQAKRIGAATMGATSTTLDKTLPNAWVFSISNEVYMDKQGNNYENIGVPVDYKLNYPRDRQDFFRSVINDLARDKQNILRAVKMLEAK